MKTFKIDTEIGRYPIFLGRNIISTLKEHIGGYDKILLLSNVDIGEIYFDKVSEILGYKNIYRFAIEEGEKHKNLVSVSTIYDFMAMNNFSRKSLIISLGGGVVCDIGGFVGATYMRGIDFIQIPTTLLSQVDASIGGKTGVDTSYGKNLIGAFKNPKAVLIDVEFLSTLPKKEFSSGMGEVIKHSLITQDKTYIEFLSKNYDKILNLDKEYILSMIEKSIVIKKEIVENDPFEKGERALLNLGHTYAHALESVFDYEHISHGEAVAKGIIFELHLSLQKASKNIEDKIYEIIKIFKLYGLNPHPIYFENSVLLEKMRRDKKNSYDKISFILFDECLKVYKDFVEEEFIIKTNEFFKDRYIKGIVDIGTNSCRLFLAQVYEEGEKIIIEQEISKDVEIVKLGEDVGKNGYLKENAISRTLKCLENYVKKAQRYGAKKISAFATSATRDAKNREEFLEEVKKLGIHIRCISGEEEGEITFLGTSQDFDKNILVLDIGGGSTEFIYGNSKDVEFLKSLDMGGVRMTELFFAGDNYDKLDDCREWIEEKLEENLKDVGILKDKNFTLVGVAGTATTQISVSKKMKIYDPSQIHRSKISIEELYQNLELFLSCDLEKRKKIVGLEEKRADVIVAGTLILITIMEKLGIGELVVSEKDNLDGAMLTSF